MDRLHSNMYELNKSMRTIQAYEKGSVILEEKARAKAEEAKIKDIVGLG